MAKTIGIFGSAQFSTPANIPDNRIAGRRRFAERRLVAHHQQPFAKPSMKDVCGQSVFFRGPRADPVSKSPQLTTAAGKSATVAS